MGVLNAATDVRVNLVNAPAMAHERGIKVIEEKDPEGDEEYVNLVGVEVRSTVDTSYLAGTSVHGRVHLLRVNDFYLDMEPSAPYMLFTTHTDQPGIIGKLGTIAGEHDVNISFMEVGRAAPRGAATMIVGFDDPVPDEMLEAIRSHRRGIEPSPSSSSSPHRPPKLSLHVCAGRKLRTGVTGNPGLVLVPVRGRVLRCGAPFVRKITNQRAR